MISGLGSKLHQHEKTRDLPLPYQRHTFTLIISREKNREFTIWKLPVQRRKPFNSQLETVRFPVQDEADAG